MIRSTIKTGFACWIGIFLILPGCLCQLLAGIGINLHGEEVPETAFIAPGFASLLDCHCDDPTGKTAEISPSEIRSQPDGARFVTLGDQPPIPPANAFSSNENARAPPSAARPRSAPLFCALISVWLV